MRRWKWTTLIAVIAALGTAPSATAAGALDQENSSGDIGHATMGCSPSFNPGTPCVDFSRAQTFTAGLTGKLDPVELHLFRGESTTTPLTVEIRAASEGCPSGAAGVLATETIPASQVPVGQMDWVAITFSDPADVVAGTQYAIVAYTTPGAEAGYGWTAGNGSYAGGQLCNSRSSPPASWTGEPGYDLYFKTYVGAGCQGETVNPTVGTPGDDELVGTPARDAIFGLAGDDSINGAQAGDCLYGQAGSDALRGGGGPDLLAGGGAADALYGGAAGDRMFGNDGADKLNGGGRRDRIAGGDGADKLRGNGGNDILRGQRGADRLNGSAGRDVLNCGPGRDVAIADRLDKVGNNCEVVKVKDKE